MSELSQRKYREPSENPLSSTLSSKKAREPRSGLEEPEQIPWRTPSSKKAREFRPGPEELEEIHWHTVLRRNREIVISILNFSLLFFSIFVPLAVVPLNFDSAFRAFASRPCLFWVGSLIAVPQICIDIFSNQYPASETPASFYLLLISVSFLLFFIICIAETENRDIVDFYGVITNSLLLYGCGRVIYRCCCLIAWALKRENPGIFLGSGKTNLEYIKIRLMWRCSCGKNFFHDVDETLFGNSSSFRTAISSLPLGVSGSSGSLPNLDTQHKTASRYSALAKGSVRSALTRRSGLGAASSSRDQTRASTTIVNQDNGISETKPSGRWLLASFPTQRVVWHLDVNNGENDRDVFDEIKRRYYIERKALWRFLQLRSVSNIRPMQMYLRPNPSSSRPPRPPIAAIYAQWSWIDAKAAAEEWEFEDAEFPIEILEQIATELWKGAGHAVAFFPNEDLPDQHQAQSQDSLPRHRGETNHLGGSDRTLTLRGWLQSLVRRRKLDKSRDPEGLEYRGMYENWLKAFGHAGGLASFSSRSNSASNSEPNPSPSSRWSMGDDSGDPSRDVFLRKMPKKINTQLTPASQPMPKGWGILIEESFAIHWALIAVVYALPGGFAVFSFVWTFKHGFTIWAIAGWILTFCTGLGNLVMAKKQTKAL